MGVGMKREVKQLFGIRDLDNVALIDDSNAVRDKADNRQVVRDKQIGRSPLALELFQQVQNLSADGNIQRGDRFVRNHKLRFHHHCSCQTDSLALTAGEFVRIAGQVLRKQTDFLNYLFNFADPISFILIKMEVIKTLGNDIFHRCALIQRRGRILKHHLDITDDLTVQ